MLICKLTAIMRNVILPFTIHLLTSSNLAYIYTNIRVNIYSYGIYLYQSEYSAYVHSLLCLIADFSLVTDSTHFQSCLNLYAFPRLHSVRLYHIFIMQLECFITFYIPYGVFLTSPNIFFFNLHTFRYTLCA